MLYIAEPFPYEPEETKQARQFVKETRNFKEGLIIYALRLGHERAMMNHLIANPDDFAGAFLVLPKNLYRIFVHGYQSYIYNTILCRGTFNSSRTACSISPGTPEANSVS